MYIAARSRDKAEEAIKELKETTGKTALFVQLDLADLASVKAAAQDLLEYVLLLKYPAICD